MRSTPEDARLEAMASPLDTNSSVMLVLIDRAETYHVTAARGTSAGTRKTTILPRRPSLRPRRTVGCSVFCSDCASLVRAMEISCGLGAAGQSPIGAGHPALALDAGEVHAVKALVALGAEGERRADAEVDIAKRLEGLPQARPGRIGAGPSQRFDGDLGVDETLEADEAVALGGVAPVTQRLRKRRAVLVHERAVLGDPGQAQVVVARHDLGIHEGAQVVAAGRLTLLEQERQHRVRADEGDVRYRHGPSPPPRGPSDGGAAPL